MADTIASVLFFAVLLVPQLATSYHTSYTQGSRQFIRRSLGDSQASSVPAACSSIRTGLSNDKLPVVHRLSPCSPVSGVGKTSNLSSTDVFRRDVSRVRSIFGARPSVGDAAVPAPAPAPGGLTIPTNSTPIDTAPGVQDYNVLVGYGSPVQQLPVFLDTGLGTSLLRCKPCLPGVPCDPAFDPSQSATFSNVPCGSADCRSSCSGATCPLSFQDLNGTVVQDVLSLTTSASLHNFTFGCVEPGWPMPVVGVLDLSRDSRSLASRLSSSGVPAFSYCLPLSTSSHGFLSVGTSKPENPGGHVPHAPLVHNADFPNTYFIELIGMSLGGKDLLIPPTAVTANSTVLDVVTSFTFLKPDVYAPLRDAFRKAMSQYPTAPAFHSLDTCYNFTGLNEIVIPLVRLKFGNGESLLLDGDQMLYYEDPSAGPFSVACLAFAPFSDVEIPYSIIGTLAQTSTEVVYDVSGGKVGFIPHSC